ncbi:hypothetical protein KM043_016781 [Ampulex compressa]|nr:hypothetical protein KM043_016781 [Ampulex compressa]
MALLSPFKYDADIRNELKADLKKVKIDDTCLSEPEVEKKIGALCKWICSTPKITTLRINTAKMTIEAARLLIEDLLKQDSKRCPTLSLLPEIPEVIVIESWDTSVKLDLEKYPNEIIIDASCGSAVLRGSHIFAPGVIGIPYGLIVNDKASVFADITGHCKKGLTKRYENENKIFVGNGIVKQTREQLFGPASECPSGIAVYMTDVVSRIPQINDNARLKGNALLQNLPSIICSRVLNPQPGEMILDMCAAPGNKTTHISCLMKGKGTLIAMEKNKSKIERLKKNCEEFAASNVKIVCYDATKAVSDQPNATVVDGPPFAENYFDRILLDGPCSALGQRPQIRNPITVAQLRSYVPLQRKLFSAAARLLKPNGVLVYSTCTITVAENEGINSQ